MSDKPVAERLQVKHGRTLVVIGASRELDHRIGALDARSELARADVVLLVLRNRADLEAALPAMLAQASDGAILWVAYPKLSSSLVADLSRVTIHAIVPSYGLNTVSQIAIDTDWSALRLKRNDPAT